MEGGRSSFRFRVVEAVCVVFITVVGPQVEVCNDLHLLGKDIENVLLKERVPHPFNRFEVEFLAEVVQNRVSGGESSLFSRRYRGPVGAYADEDLIAVFSIYFRIVDGEIKELVLVEYIVRLHWVRRHNSASGRLN